MIDWGKLIENGKKCRIEYHFYDDGKLNACSCGGKARMYSKEHKEKKFSFEHLEISCEECFKHISGVYDISGNTSDTYIFDKCPINGNYNWNMPGKRK